jgi:kynureninase
MFSQAGMKRIRKKSMMLTGYLEYLLKEVDASERYYTIITPADLASRGCQLSVLMKRNGKSVYRKLLAAGVMADWREPDVIRLAPVPLYNSFEDVFRFAKIFRQILA